MGGLLIPFNKCFLKIDHVQGSALGFVETSVAKLDKVSTRMELSLQWGILKLYQQSKK